MSNYDASNRRHVGIAKKSAERAARGRREFIANIMSTTVGRAWAYEHLERCHIFTSTFDGNALYSAFNEGRRSVGLGLLDDIMTVCPDQYTVMMQEKNVKEVTEDGRRNQSDYDASVATLVSSDGRPLVDPTRASG